MATLHAHEDARDARAARAEPDDDDKKLEDRRFFLRLMRDDDDIIPDLDDPDIPPFVWDSLCSRTARSQRKTEAKPLSTRTRQGIH